ncbi:hypothetical protein G7046_g2985 [Stylonectria norvegica]|nr:hypothetical protein G7046_g2985 [Stylonectria norvegica]
MAFATPESVASNASRDDKNITEKTPYDLSRDGESQHESSDVTAGLTGYVLDHKAERALCRKLDIRLLPVLAIMFLLNGLDKGNLGNAKTAGMDKDLHFKSNQYNLALSIFYIPFVLTAPPLGILGKKYGPSRVLPCMMLVFGSMTVLAVTAQNWAGIMALRWFLGMAESAMLPLIMYYLTTFYRRGELARRLSIFYASSKIANAFSGLLAYGVFHIKITSLYPWRYLFLIEGCLTVVFAVFVWFYLPLSPDKARFLSAEEKILAHHRIQVDSSAIVNQKFNLRDALKIFRQPTTYAFLAIEICIGVPLQSVALFLPQIIGRLGYSAVKTNLYTVAPNITGAAMIIILAFCSDFTKRRGPFIVLAFMFTLIAFIIYATIDVLENLHVAYFATFMMCWGAGAPSILLCTWYNNNIPHEGRRMALTSIGVPLCNLMGLISSNIFTPQSAPKYIPALATTAAFGATGVVLASAMSLFMVLDNKRRDRKLGRKLDIQETPTELLLDGPSVPEFRCFL